MNASTSILERSYEKIDMTDLGQLAVIAQQDREDLFQRKFEIAALYRDRLLCVALCQGAAWHFVDPSVGVKDFDVWSFYAAHPERPFPYRRRGIRDFGPSKFGRHPSDTGFAGRRVDLIGRSLKCDVDADPAKEIASYLRQGRTRSARELAKKAVVIIDPPPLCGKVAWPIGTP